MSPEPKVARDVAEAEFDKWAKAMRLERKLDPSTLDDEDKKGLAVTKATILGAIQDGILAVDEEGRFVMTVGEKRVLFKKPKGADLMAIDSAKAEAGVQKTVKFLTSVTGGQVSFAQMDLADVQICDAIATLFLAR